MRRCPRSVARRDVFHANDTSISIPQHAQKLFSVESERHVPVARNSCSAPRELTVAQTH
jgi:hypothetical protein